MGVDVDTAQGDDGGADENEHQYDQYCDNNSEDLTANTYLVTFPINVLRRGDFGILDLERPALI